MTNQDIIARAYAKHTIVPAFNIPHLPMVGAVVRAVRDEDSFALIQVARLEWEKFESQSLQAVAAEYTKHADPKHTRLHLDHVPVIDEDKLNVDYMPIIQAAIEAGYGSVMVDGSRLPLDGNIAATHEVVQCAHTYGVPVEAELGAVLGHESGPLPPYDEIFESGQGFTKVDEAVRFVKESGCDWLSVAIGNIHGAISETARHAKKPNARLSIPHLKELNAALGIPLVLHGGSGIQRAYILEGIQNGIAKINVGTEIRQAYELALPNGVEAAQESVYKRTRELLHDFFAISGNAAVFKD